MTEPVAARDLRWRADAAQASWESSGRPKPEPKCPFNSKLGMSAAGAEAKEATPPFRSVDPSVGIGIPGLGALVRLLRPQPLTTHGDRRRRGRRVSLVLRVSTYLPTPPHDSWRSREAEKQNGRWTERPERTPGEQCKIRTMHHQQSTTKRSKPQPRKTVSRKYFESTKIQKKCSRSKTTNPTT